LANVHPGKDGLGNSTPLERLKLFEGLACPKAQAFSPRKAYTAIGAVAVAAVLDF
jgi:hypothetical protein